MTQTATISRAPQHLQALERANAVRLARAALKRAVAAGEIRVADVIRESPWEAESMTVADLLASQRRWGQTRCRRFLQGVPLPESKTIGSMTMRQRLAVAELLGAAPRPEPAETGAAGSPDPRAELAMAVA